MFYLPAAGTPHQKIGKQKSNVSSVHLNCGK